MDVSTHLCRCEAIERAIFLAELDAKLTQSVTAVLASLGFVRVAIDITHHFLYLLVL